MKSIIVALSVVAMLVATVAALEFQDCGSKVGKFTKIGVSGCDTSKASCVLKRGTNATISIDFELLEDQAEAVTTVVHGIIMGVEMPFPLQNPNGCVDSGLTCPLSKASTYEYVASLSVLKSYPKVKVDVKWQLQNENKEDIVCVIIPAKIEA